MDNVNKTLYIPLYGKAYVSRKGILLQDVKAEEIWQKEGFQLKGKSASKWLAYYMGMRSAVFDGWVKKQLSQAEIKEDNAMNNSGNLPDMKEKNTVVLHIGCGMDSRVLRVGNEKVHWYDVDFTEVISERKKYYKESEYYHMFGADARETGWIKGIPGTNAIVVLEGISMYFKIDEMRHLLGTLSGYFEDVHVLMDCYTKKAARASKYKNPINDVGVTVVYGIDEPYVYEEDTGLKYLCEHDMTPEAMTDQLAGVEKAIFKHVFGGKISKAMYRMYEYEKNYGWNFR